MAKIELEGIKAIDNTPIGQNTPATGAFTDLSASNVADFTSSGMKTKYDVGDYGGGFSTYTPPTGAEGLIVVAIDTNATTPGKRLYIYANSTWNYVDLT